MTGDRRPETRAISVPSFCVFGYLFAKEFWFWRGEGRVGGGFRMEAQPERSGAERRAGGGGRGLGRGTVLRRCAGCGRPGSLVVYVADLLLCPGCLWEAMRAED